VAVLGIDTSAALSVAIIKGIKHDAGRLETRVATSVECDRLPSIDPVPSVECRRRPCIETTEPTGASTTRMQAELLAPTIQRVLRAEGLTMADLTAITVGIGPGPFTGLRVGIATARAMGLALGIPVWGVPSHDAFALIASPLGIADLLVVTDARRKEVYWSRYRPAGDGPAVAGPGVVKPANLATVLDGTDPADVVVLGEGVRRYRNELAEAGFDLDRSAAIMDDDPGYEMLLFPAAEAVASLGYVRAKHGVAQPTTPLYLRRPDVQPPASAAARAQ